MKAARHFGGVVVINDYEAGIVAVYGVPVASIEAIHKATAAGESQPVLAAIGSVPAGEAAWAKVGSGHGLVGDKAAYHEVALAMGWCVIAIAAADCENGIMEDLNS